MNILTNLKNASFWDNEYAKIGEIDEKWMQMRGK